MKSRVITYHTNNTTFAITPSPIIKRAVIRQSFPLQPRINLRQQIPARIAHPVPAVLIRCRRDNHVLNISRPLHDISIQAAGKVPSNMAVERPDTGIVLLPLEDLTEEERWD